MWSWNNILRYFNFRIWWHKTITDWIWSHFDVYTTETIAELLQVALNEDHQSFDIHHLCTIITLLKNSGATHFFYFPFTKFVTSLIPNLLRADHQGACNRNFAKALVVRTQEMGVTPNVQVLRWWHTTCSIIIAVDDIACEIFPFKVISSTQSSNDQHWRTLRQTGDN